MRKTFAILLLTTFTLACGETTTEPGATDSDSDGHPDTTDNCSSVYNPSQSNLYGTALGDACEDTDDDGSMDSDDPCPTDPTDSCGGTDTDGDGYNDDVDNCPAVSNASQADNYGTALGDACEDSDTDGTLDDTDNCPTTSNSGQENGYGTSAGDACEDTDSDGDNDDVDPCPTDPANACAVVTYQIKNVSQDTCLKQSGNLSAASCNTGDSAQVWEVISLGGGKYQIKEQSLGECADWFAYGWNTNTCGGGSDQSLSFSSDGSGYDIKTDGANSCIRAGGSVIYGTLGNCGFTNTAWKFIRVSDSVEVNPNTL